MPRLRRPPLAKALTEDTAKLAVTCDPASLLRPAGDDVLRLWPVSRAVNSVRNNGAELLDAIDAPHAPPPSDAPAWANPA